MNLAITGLDKSINWHLDTAVIQHLNHYYLDQAASSRLRFYGGSSILVQTKPFISALIWIQGNHSDHITYEYLEDRISILFYYTELLVSPVVVQNCSLCRTICHKHWLSFTDGHRCTVTSCLVYLEVQPCVFEAQWGTVNLNALSQEVRSFHVRSYSYKRAANVNTYPKWCFPLWK